MAISLLASACNGDRKTSDDSQSKTNEVSIPKDAEISFVEAKNYFVKNTYKDTLIHAKVIKDQKEFDEIFGMATTMSADGKPTEIDFTKNYAIICIGQTTNKSQEINIVSLKKINDDVELSYSEKIGETLTYSLRNCKILIVDGSVQGNVILKKQEK